ncbi:hypothetical protein BGX26_012789 [Mortierella sp. AD094]|nr:hypothetical protein BGX26_012789 [Mortierella sp. AD094]
MHRSGQALLPQLIVKFTAKSAPPLPSYCRCQPQPRRSHAVTYWTQSLHTVAPSVPRPKSDPSSSSTRAASAATVEKTKSKGHPPVRPDGKFRRKPLLASRLRLSQDRSIPSNITTMLNHLSDIHPGDYNRLLKGTIGERRLNNLTRLHDTLQDTNNLDAIWEIYQEIRKISRDLELLSEEVFRLLVVHFKEAAKLTSKNGGVLPDEVWYARIVTVLDDKRSAKDGFTRWDYSDLMSALNQLGRYEESLQEFERAVESWVKVDPILLNHAVRAWGGLGQLDKAVETIRDIKSRFGAKASEYTLGYLIQQYLFAGEKAKAVALWQELIGDGSLESIEVVNGILKACVKLQESKFAQNIYDALPGLRIESNLESLNLMLSLAVAEIQYSGERSQFLQTIHDKVTTSDRQVFDRNVLSSILTNFSKKGDAEGAILVHQLMVRCGFQPGIGEHNNILHCYARLQQSDKAVEWLQLMRRLGIQPNRSTYVLLMHSFTRQRMPRETEALFRQLISDGIEPDLAICNHLLLAYEQARMNRRCLQLYKNMFNERSIGLDQLSFSCMFNAVFHSEKAHLEGGEGLCGNGAIMLDPAFQRKIGEPIRPIFPSEEGQIMPLNTQPQSQYNTQQQYQFGNVASTTEFLNPRTIFRDMIIVGIRPSRSLYSNILRAFLAQNDFAGATVALRALVDYFVLRPTPKMKAIVVSWVCQELERRGIENNSPLSKGELSKVISMMERTRGLMEMLERLVNGELRVKSEDMAWTPSLTEPRSRMKGFPEDQGSDIITQVKMEMGGDLADLYSRSVLAGSSWSTTEDNPSLTDLKDFERWYRAYSNRVTLAQAIKAKP